MRVLVSYDISDDKRRYKVAKIIEGYGYRVQYSVFECDLETPKLAELSRRLRPLVNPKSEESIRFYQLCADCAPKVKVIGLDQARFLGPGVIV